MILTEIAAGNIMKREGWLCTTQATVITLPEEVADVDFCTCLFVCDYIEDAYVLSTNEDDTYRNDYRRVLVTLRDSSSTYLFQLVDSSGTTYDLIDNTYGELFDLGFNTVQPLKASYRIDWFKVFENIGYGNYTIKVSQTDFGTTVIAETHIFRVIEFSELISNNSTKIETVQRGTILNGEDFGGMDYRNMVRLKGSFGGIDPQYELNRLVDSNRKDIDVQTDVFLQYTLNTELIPSSIGNKLIKEDVLTDEIFISNYNVFAYEQYRRLPVTFEGTVDAGEDYPANLYKKFTVTFKDDKSRVKRNFV